MPRNMDFSDSLLEVKGGKGKMKNNGLLLDNKNIVTQTLSILFDPNQVIEVRALANNAIYSGYFDDMGKAAQAVHKFDSVPSINGIYIVLNEINPDLLARRANRLPKVGRNDSTTNDTNIIRRRWLPIDIDPKRLSGISSSDEEHNNALQKAEKIAMSLSEFGFPSPIKADSGNGAHLLYRVDLENSDETRNLIQNCLEVLSIIHSDESCDVDTSVFNAARIWKLYGTISRKGDNVSNRPHRRSRLLYVPKNIDTVSQKQLEKLSGFLPKSLQAEQKQTFSSTSQGPFSSEKKIDLGVWLEEHAIKVYNKKKWMDGILYNLDQCPFSDEHRSGSYAIQFPNGKIKVACFHNSCGSGKQRWHELWGKYESNSQPTSNQKYDHVDNLTLKEDDNISLTNTVPPKAQTQKTNYTKVVQSEEFNIDDSVSIGILRCVLLLGKKAFGERQIIDILIGNNIAKIRRYSHNDLTVFGILDKYSDADMSNKLEDLIRKDYLIRNVGLYKTIHLTQKGFQHLKALDHSSIASQSIDSKIDNESREWISKGISSILSKNMRSHEYLKKSSRITYELFKKGNTIGKIAKIREYEESTIVSHLITCMFLGTDVSFDSIDDYVSIDAQNEIINVLKTHGFSSLKSIKESLENDYTYSQISLVIAWTISKNKDLLNDCDNDSVQENETIDINDYDLENKPDILTQKNQHIDDEYKIIQNFIKKLDSAYESDRAFAAEVLGKIGGVQAVFPLIEASNDQNYTVRAAVATAFGQLKDPIVFPQLIQLLRDKSYIVRSNALKALYDLNDRKACKSIIRLLNDPHSNIREGAAFVLGSIGDASVVPSLLAVLERNGQDNVKINALISLGKIGGVDVFEPISSALKNPNTSVVEAAAESLGSLKDPRALNYLKNMTTHSSATVRKGVICGLGLLGDKNAIDVITPLLKDEFHAVRISAAEALGNLGGIKSMDPLLEALKDEHPDVRCTVAEALGQLGYNQALDSLYRLRNDIDYGVRKCAKKAIATIERNP